MPPRPGQVHRGAYKHTSEADLKIPESHITDIGQKEDFRLQRGKTINPDEGLKLPIPQPIKADNARSDSKPRTPSSSPPSERDNPAPQAGRIVRTSEYSSEDRLVLGYLNSAIEEYDACISRLIKLSDSV